MVGNMMLVEISFSSSSRTLSIMNAVHSLPATKNALKVGMVVPSFVFVR